MPFSDRLPASLPAQALHLHLHRYDDTEQAALVLVLPEGLLFSSFFSPVSCAFTVFLF